MNIDKDAFSSGQIGSKIWLCEELEKLNWYSSMTYIYGGWHGLTAFLLLSRGNFLVEKIRSLDIDPNCEAIADMINENWVWQGWKFKAFTQDCNLFNAPYGDLIINTSTEHFESNQWFDNIAPGTRVILQGNNMHHDEDTHIVNSINEFADLYPLTTTLYQGSKDFVYPDWKFTRYMLIGIK
jgi:hypothetical protein